MVEFANASNADAESDKEGGVEGAAASFPGLESNEDSDPTDLEISAFLSMFNPESLPGMFATGLTPPYSAPLQPT